MKKGGVIFVLGARLKMAGPRGSAGILLEEAS